MSCKICGRGACASWMHSTDEQALANKLEDMTPRQAYDLGYDKGVEDAPSPTEADQRDAIIRECWDAINANIKEGDLGGSGWDKNAERNGMVLAANILADKMGWPLAYREAERKAALSTDTPQPSAPSTREQR